MALLRRRKKQEDPPAADEQPREPSPATSPDDWRPATMAPRASTPPPVSAQQRRESAAEWMPDGVKAPAPGFRNARSSGAIPIPTELIDTAQPGRESTTPSTPVAPVADPPPAASAPVAPVADPPPAASAPPVAAPVAEPLAPVSAPPAAEPAPASTPSQRDELNARIASLEDQIAAAKASNSSEQAATIRALQLRLASLEDDLDKTGPGHVRPAPPAATTLRVLVAILLFLVIAGSPLFMSRRTVCHVHGRPQTHWAIVKPFDDSGKRGCDNQLGGSVLVDSLGLK